MNEILIDVLEFEKEQIIKERKKKAEEGEIN